MVQLNEVGSLETLGTFAVHQRNMCGPASCIILDSVCPAVTGDIGAAVSFALVDQGTSCSALCTLGTFPMLHICNPSVGCAILDSVEGPGDIGVAVNLPLVGMVTSCPVLCTLGTLAVLQ